MLILDTIITKMYNYPEKPGGFLFCLNNFITTEYHLQPS